MARVERNDSWQRKMLRGGGVGAFDGGSACVCVVHVKLLLTLHVGEWASAMSDFRRRQFELALCRSILLVGADSSIADSLCGLCCRAGDLPTVLVLNELDVSLSSYDNRSVSRAISPMYSLARTSEVEEDGSV